MEDTVIGDNVEKGASDAVDDFERFDDIGRVSKSRRDMQDVENLVKRDASKSMTISSI